MSAISGAKLAAVLKPMSSCTPDRIAIEGAADARRKPDDMAAAAPISDRVTPKRSTARPISRLPSPKPTMVSV